MYILMCGTGVGFSVEKKYVDQLPTSRRELPHLRHVIDVYDSKIGWAKAFRQLISLLYNGDIPRWTTHRVRPAGARLKTFGGRASGPEPLEDLFHFSVNMFTEGSRSTAHHSRVPRPHV
jgi:ribonucleoside-triphosphate reductase